MHLAGTSFIGSGVGATKIWAHHNGPAFHCANFHQEICNLEINSFAGRTAGDGILKEIENNPSLHGKFHLWQNIRIRNQPGSAVRIKGSFSAVDLNLFQLDNNGKGLVVESGIWRAGGISARNGVIRDSVGYAIQIGGRAGVSWDYPYRILIDNVDTYRNGIGEENHCWYIYGENVQIIRCGIGSDMSQRGVYVSGRAVELNNNRYVNLLPIAVNFGSNLTDNVQSRALILNEAHVSGFTANPLVYVDNTVRDWCIISRNTQNIASVVNDSAKNGIAELGSNKIPIVHD